MPEHPSLTFDHAVPVQIHRHEPLHEGGVYTHEVLAVSHAVQPPDGAGHGQIDEHPLEVSTHPFVGWQYHWHPATHAELVVVEHGPPVVVAPPHAGAVWSEVSRPQSVVVVESASGQNVGARHLHPVPQVEDVCAHVFVEAVYVHEHEPVQGDAVVVVRVPGPGYTNASPGAPCRGSSHTFALPSVGTSVRPITS